MFTFVRSRDKDIFAFNQFKPMDIKKLRKERKVTLKEISEKTGINCVTLRKLEQGNSRQDLVKVKAYLSAIGYTLLVIDSAYLVSAQKGIE